MDFVPDAGIWRDQKFVGCADAISNCRLCRLGENDLDEKWRWFIRHTSQHAPTLKINQTAGKERSENKEAFEVQIAFGGSLEKQVAIGGEIVVPVVKAQVLGHAGQGLEFHEQIGGHGIGLWCSTKTPAGRFQVIQATGKGTGNQMVGVVCKTDHQGTGAFKVSERYFFRICRGDPGIAEGII